MGQVTTAVDDEEIINHFQTVLAPYVVETQLCTDFTRAVSPHMGLHVANRRADHDSDCRHANPSWLNSTMYSRKDLRVLQKTRLSNGQALPTFVNRTSNIN